MSIPRSITMTSALKNAFEKDYFSIDQTNAEKCWPWAGKNSDGDGYGIVYCKKRAYRASRISYMLANNLDYLPGGASKLILHSCDNPPCINPNHLSLGTNQENIEQAIARGLIKYPERKSNRLDLIHEFHRNGLSIAEIAKKLGLAQSQVKHIIDNGIINHIDL